MWVGRLRREKLAVLPKLQPRGQQSEKGAFAVGMAGCGASHLLPLLADAPLSQMQQVFDVHKPR